MDLAVFDFEDKVIRTSKTVDGEPLVCALDLARACGLKNPRDSYSRVSESYKVVGKSDTLGGDQKMVFFTEPGVYQFLLVLRPKKSSPMSVRVGRLQRWVFEEVLPTPPLLGLLGSLLGLLGSLLGLAINNDLRKS